MLGFIAARPAHLAALAVALIASSCPYDSTTPIADASTVAFDKGIDGKWRCVGGNDDDPAMLTFTRTSPAELGAVLEAKGEKLTQFRFHSAKSGKVPLVNLEAPGENHPWMLARLTLLRPSVLQLEFASEDPFKAAPTKRHSDVIAQSLKRGDLFGEPLVCARMSTRP